jgi:hypothetical protein
VLGKRSVRTACGGFVFFLQGASAVISYCRDVSGATILPCINAVAPG